MSRDRRGFRYYFALLPLNFVRRLSGASRSMVERSELARRLARGLGIHRAKNASEREKELARSLEKMEDQGLLRVDRGLIHPPIEGERDPSEIERRVVKVIRESGGFDLEEKTDVYLTRLRQTDGIFSWRHSWIYTLKIYIENLIFFWKSPLSKGYREAGRLATRFAEWETMLMIQSAPSPVERLFDTYFAEVNQIPSATLLTRTSFGQANRDSLGAGPVVIISDLHLSSGSKFDRFNKAAKLIRLLKVVEKLHATLVINGDFFDFWQTTPRHVFSKYKEILWELIRIRRVIMIVGNHDAWLANFNNQRFLMPNISIMESLYDPANNLYIEHGHLGDPVNRSAAGEIISKTIGAVERIIRTRFAERLERVARFITPKKFWYEQQLQSYVKRLSEIYQEELKLNPGAEGRKPLRIVFGHIHYRDYLRTIEEIKQQCRLTLPHVEFYSSGQWTDVRPVFLFLESGELHTVSLQGSIDDFLVQLRQ